MMNDVPSKRSLYDISERTKKRNAAEGRFRLYGIIAIAIGLLMLLVLVTTIIFSATHINGKATFFAHPNSSPNTKTATKNISVGAIYCNIAMVESFNNFAPFA